MKKLWTIIFVVTCMYDYAAAMQKSYVDNGSDEIYKLFGWTNNDFESTQLGKAVIECIQTQGYGKRYIESLINEAYKKILNNEHTNPKLFIKDVVKLCKKEKINEQTLLKKSIESSAQELAEYTMTYLNSIRGKEDDFFVAPSLERANIINALIEKYLTSAC